MSNKTVNLAGDFDFMEFSTQVQRDIVKRVLGWFTIGIYAFFRRNFGERYFTFSNFMVGLIVYFLTASLASTLSSSPWLNRITEPGVEPIGWAAVTPWILLSLYIVISMYHFWKIWVNGQIGEPEFSRYDGHSRLEPLGRLILNVINPIVREAVKFVSIFTLNSENRLKLSESLEILPVFYDVEVFTKRWVEPFCFLLLWNLIPGVNFIWAAVTLFAILIYAQLLMLDMRDQELDLSDSILMAYEAKAGGRVEILKERRRILAQAMIHQMDEPQKEVFIQEVEDNPDLMETLESLNINIDTKQAVAS